MYNFNVFFFIFNNLLELKLHVMPIDVDLGVDFKYQNSKNENKSEFKMVVKLIFQK
jgi:hypothetical protein